MSRTDLILCSGPNHQALKGHPGWETTLGTIELPDDTTDAEMERAAAGYLCGACAADAQAHVAPPAPTVDDFQARLAKATTISGVKAVMTDFMEAFGPTG